jgi:hypothetical protein
MLQSLFLQSPPGLPFGRALTQTGYIGREIIALSPTQVKKDKLILPGALMPSEYKKYYCGLVLLILSCGAFAQQPDKQKLSQHDYYYLCDDALKAIENSVDSTAKQIAYKYADSICSAYVNAYPDNAYVYSLRVKIAQKMDSTGAKAVRPEEDYINFLMRDTTKNGPAIAYYHAILGGYFANVPKNLDSAVTHFELSVRYDPANEQFKKYYDLLRKARDRKRMQLLRPQPINDLQTSIITPNRNN